MFESELVRALMALIVVLALSNMALGEPDSKNRAYFNVACLLANVFLCFNLTVRIFVEYKLTLISWMAKGVETTHDQNQFTEIINGFDSVSLIFFVIGCLSLMMSAYYQTLKRADNISQEFFDNAMYVFVPGLITGFVGLAIMVVMAGMLTFVL